MLTIEILRRLDNAIQQLFDHEIDILSRSLHELNISNHLSRYLHPLFTDYNVDAEYNGDISKINDRKEIEIAQNRFSSIRRKVHENNLYRLTPDIIVHTRNNNDNNLLVIEVKKDISSHDEKEYDLLKLEHMTIDYTNNHYNFQVGVALIFGTGINAGEVDKIVFQNGIQINFEI